jgi:ATP-dependent protease HslVU (ClpYQ) peptidase subunit
MQQDKKSKDIVKAPVQVTGRMLISTNRNWEIRRLLAVESSMFSWNI